MQLQGKMQQTLDRAAARKYTGANECNNVNFTFGAKMLT